MSAEHKQALAEGRSDSRAVRDYLDAIDAIKPKRGRPRTADPVRRQRADVERELDEARGEDRLLLIQRRIDLVEELASLEAKADLSQVEEAFLSVAKRYSERKGVSYAAWREMGVEAAVLKKAGITRSM